MSGALPYFGDAYMADTRHLTLEEHGAYHLLILIAWRSPNCALPDDDKRLSQMLGVTAKKWAALKPTVMAFWTRTENGWEQKRLTKERRWVDEKKDKNRAAAEARWEAKPRKNNNSCDANASANAQANDDANGDAPPPPPHIGSGSKEPSPRAWACPPGVSNQVWADLMSNRKRKRLGSTATAWKSFQDDLARVSLQTGIPPPELIERCTAKGWGAIYDPRDRRNERSDDNPLQSAVERIIGSHG